MTFQGKSALVTGAGSGIGRAVTLRLVAEGATVLAHDVDEGRLKETNELAGGVLATRVGDVTDPDECKAAVAAAVSELGQLDVLGNIAGIARGEHVGDVTVEQYRRMMGVNIDAYFFLAQAAIPHLLETGGNIVNIASNAGLMGQAYTVVYCMSKGAVVQLTKALAMEFMKTPLRVNAIAPGGVMTNLLLGFAIPEGIDDDLFSRYAGYRELVQPDEVADLFAYVASEKARRIHGAILSIDNGVTAG
ncbi:MAG: short-chain dehydrogenase/reductase [Actinomycetia bacterium]|nr:short-chain dehydrogenase/reductase [Actinomycetes bacterium]